MKRRWVIIADFFDDADGRWLDDFIEDERLSFQKIPPVLRRGSWHVQKSYVTSASGWLGHLRHARMAYRCRSDGIITCFPQLAMSVALLKWAGRAKPALIAYNYNLGKLRPGVRQWLARLVARQVDYYVVHSPQEVEGYARYLGIPESRIRFVPLQRGEIPIPRVEDAQAPFIVAMGSAQRDYPTLIKAVDSLGIPTTIVTRAADVEGFPKSRHVTFRSGMSEEECLLLLSRARLCVTPIANQTTASGQVTFINAMQLGVPVIATKSPGTDGYIDHGRTGILVKPFDVDDLIQAIEALWEHAGYRAVLSEQSRAEAFARFSDEAAARSLAEIIWAARYPGNGARARQWQS